MSELGQTSRASNALLKRQEAIKRWMISDTNRQSLHRPSNKVRITFERETVFLSAVSGGDADETKKLIDSGVDINCANVDGLTGLHQACIDENVEMVELLVNSGAYLDARDDEGWTPLHAAASAGNVQIAQVLLDKGADLLAVNNEGEIPCDLAEEEEMDEFLEEEMEKLGVEPDEIRNQEEQQMLEDATSWVNSNQVDEQYNFQGASALHVAAAKGYHKVIKLLIQAGSEVNSRDADGWTPLHAAVHWGQLDAAEILTEAGADFNLRNNIGQTPCDLADGDMMKSAEELRKKAKDLAKDGLLQRSNKIIDDNTHKRKLSLSKNKDRKALQDFSNYVHDSNAKPSKSALKGSRQQHKKAENDTNEASDESEDESGESDASESENENRPVNTAPTSVILSTPLRPSALTRPPTTASNEKVSTQRNPLIGSAPMRPPSLSKDNEKRDEHKEESIGVRVNRFKQRNEDASTTKPAEIGREVKFNIARPPGARGDDKDSSSAPNFNILRPGSTTKATEEKDNVSTFKISRPGSREADNKSSDNSTKSSFNILRPSSLRNGDKSTPAKDDGSSSTTKIDDLRSRIGPPSRPSRKDEREDDKRNATTPTASSKADEIRAKFNIPRPGDTQSAASTALSRFRERKSEMESEDNKSKNNEKGDEGKKITSGTKVEECTVVPPGVLFESILAVTMFDKINIIDLPFRAQPMKMPWFGNGFAEVMSLQCERLGLQVRDFCPLAMAAGNTAMFRQLSVKKCLYVVCFVIATPLGLIGRIKYQILVCHHFVAELLQAGGRQVKFVLLNLA
eukprot:gene12945-14277_t